MIARVRYCVGENAHSRAAAYALRTLLEMVVSPESLLQGPAAKRSGDEVLVTYGVVAGATGDTVRICMSDFFGDRYGKLDDMPQHPVVRVENIPALYRDERVSTGTFFSVRRDGLDVSVECHVDVVASAFFMLSRYEETVVQALDALGRFPVESSVAFREGFLEEPIVNQYAEQLLKMLRIAGFTGERRRWWGKAPWAIALTHDIDQLYRFPRGRFPALGLARSLAGRAPADAPRPGALMNDYVDTVTRRKTDEYDCLEDMATWEASAGMHSAYYFLGDSTERHAADYIVGDATYAATQMKMVTSLGHEVGFHAGFQAFKNAERFHGELSRVRSPGLPVSGGRQHYLRWQTPVTWRLWEMEGLTYDATLGYSKTAGFRCGTCLPFHPYDMANDREMSISEWPLMFMDNTYFSSWPEGTKALDHLSGECRRYGGVLVLLWHNKYWSDLYAHGVRSCFQESLLHWVAQGVPVDSISGLTRLSDAASTDGFAPSRTHEHDGR